MKRPFQWKTVDVAESARRAELLERAYRHTREYGLVGMSLRPLAQAVGSSPRVLLYLFGSKDGLVAAHRVEQRELVEPDGPWAGFAAATVDDWLALLAGFAADPVDRTLVLAVLRGAMLDLLATGDHARITPAVERLGLSCG